MAYSVSAVNVYLIGKQGCGKSATGNSILKRKAFQSKLSSDGVTLRIQPEATHAADRLVRIWDGPGVTENSWQTSKVIRGLQETVNQRRSESHILLWVIRYGELCGPEDDILLKELTQSFGANFVKANTVVVVTHKDNFDSDVEESGLTFEKWASQQTGFFQKLCRMCDNKVVPIDNKSKAEDQIQRLLCLLTQTSPVSVAFSPSKQPASSTPARALPTPRPGITKLPESTTRIKHMRMDDEDNDTLKVKFQIDDLIEILSDAQHASKLASLEKVRTELKACNLSEKSDLLEAVRHEVHRKIATHHATMVDDKQTRHYLNRLAQRLQSGSSTPGPL